jgi:hypothetical protein
MKNNKESLNCYINEMRLARIAINRINQYLDDNGEVSPEDVNWGHAGSMEYITTLLTEATDMINGTGEYAK